MPTQVYDEAPTQYVGNPIITLASGSWYQSQLFDPNVFVNPLDETELCMYLSGMAAPVQAGVISIGLFTCPRATPLGPWTDQGQILVPYGSYAHVRNGTCLYVAGTFYLFYTGINSDYSTLEICLATSTDGTTFTPSGSNPILTSTGQGRNDGTTVEDPAVLFDGTNWLMVYSYRNGGTILPGFRVATATVPTTWTKAGSGDVLTTAPLYGEWHQIQQIGSTFVLTYEAGNTTTSFKIFQATSTTATGAYTNIASNPVLTPTGVPGSWDRYHVATPWMTAIDGQWYLYFQGAGDHDQPYGTNTWPLGVAVYAMAMTTFIFNAGSLALQNGSVVWGSDTIRIRLIDSSVTPLIDDTSMTGYTAIGTDATVSSKTQVNDTTNDRTVYSAANPSIVNSSTGSDYASAVVYKFSVNDAGSTPLFCLAVTPGTTAGINLLLAIPSTGLGYTQQ